jgi:hypothetical protein
MSRGLPSKAFGDWRIDTNMPVSIVSPDVEAQLKSLYAQTVSRTYVGPQGERIMLSVAYGGDQSDATRAHRPDVCYPAQGFDILSNSDAGIRVGQAELPVRHMLAKLGQRLEPSGSSLASTSQCRVSSRSSRNSAMACAASSPTACWCEFPALILTRRRPIRSKRASLPICVQRCRSPRGCVSSAARWPVEISVALPLPKS